MSSMDTTMEDEGSFISSSRDGTIYGKSDYSGWGSESMISGPNITSSSTSTDRQQQQKISTAAAAGGTGDDLTIVSSSSSSASSSWFQKNKQSEIRIFNVDFRALSQVAPCSSSNKDAEEKRSEINKENTQILPRSDFHADLSRIGRAENNETSVSLVNTLMACANAAQQNNLNKFGLLPQMQQMINLNGQEQLLELQRPQLLTPRPGTSMKNNIIMDYNGRPFIENPNAFPMTVKQPLMQQFNGQQQQIAPISSPNAQNTCFSFAEVGCIRTRNEFTCCHFSSDGKLLASAGYDKKVVLWNMATLQIETTPEEHQEFITDVRFRPNSTQLATASFDKSVRLWDAANPSYCLNSYTGHTSGVVSLDFHPKKNDLLCFCEYNDEIGYWNTSHFSCIRVSKQGGCRKVRFQPITGRLLAVASCEGVSIFDVETDRQLQSFHGHSGAVIYMCWDLNGDLLASVSEESARVWSLTTGDCIHELSANGNQFHSCVFHPSYSALLVIGGTKSLELWNMVENKSMTIPAPKDFIVALAQSPVTGMVASASLDHSVKLWK